MACEARSRSEGLGLVEYVGCRSSDGVGGLFYFLLQQGISLVAEYMHSSAFPVYLSSIIPFSLDLLNSLAS